MSNRLQSRPGPAAFPAGPRGAPRVSRGESSLRAAREIAARESCGDSFFTAGADQRDFEGRRGERLRAGAHRETLVTLRAPAAGRLPLAAMSEEQGREELLRRYRCDERPSDGSVGNLRGRAGACRRGRRADAGAASPPTSLPRWLAIRNLPRFSSSSGETQTA